MKKIIPFSTRLVVSPVRNSSVQIVESNENTSKPIPISVDIGKLKDLRKTINCYMIKTD